MVQRSIDLNSDMGEAFGAWRLGADDELLKVVSSANIACGFHAGDPSVMRQTVRNAVSHGVTLGAHISYPDLQGFGRRAMDIEAAELTDLCLYQIGALDGFARAEGSGLRYVKPHGALYNTASTDRRVASAVIEAVRDFDRSLAVMCQPGSALEDESQATGVRVIAEGFADRGYLRDGTLAPRSQPLALIHDPDVVADRVARMVREQTVETVDHENIDLAVDTICVHSDTPGAVAIAHAIIARLAADDIVVRSPFEVTAT